MAAGVIEVVTGVIEVVTGEIEVAAGEIEVVTGDMIVVRYADDLVAGFQHRADAERILKELQERLAKFGLEVHPEQDEADSVWPRSLARPETGSPGKTRNVHVRWVYALLRRDLERLLSG